MTNPATPLSPAGLMQSIQPTPPIQPIQPKSRTAPAAGGSNPAAPVITAPLISIIIPVYNGGEYLAQAIDSALAQTYEHCEVIVVNDGSKDQGRTERVARSYGSRIRYLRKPNGGVASALNCGISKMHGTWFSWLSHDDIYEPRKIEDQYRAALAASPEDVVVYSDFCLFSEKGSRCDIRLVDTTPQGFRYRLARSSQINGCTLLIPKQALDHVGGFNETMRTTQDYELWFRLASWCKFVHVPSVLVASRSHAQQGLFTQTDLARTEREALHAMFAEKLHDHDLPVSPGMGPAQLYNALAMAFWARGFVEAAQIAQRRAGAYGASRVAGQWAKWTGYLQWTLTSLAHRLLAPTTRAWLRMHLHLERHPRLGLCPAKPSH